jgi:hypothetical protein
VLRRLKLLDYLAIVISLGCVGALAAYAYQGHEGATAVLIQAQGGQWIYSLDQDREITVEGPVGDTTIGIHAGGVRVVEASCRDKVCVSMGTISTPGSWIACLPNRLFIRIQGNDAQTDATAF